MYIVCPGLCSLVSLVVFSTSARLGGVALFFSYVGVRRGWLTKSSPEFYDPILEHDDVRHLGRGELWLLDDSPVNLEARHGRGRLLLKF